MLNKIFAKQKFFIRTKTISDIVYVVKYDLLKLMNVTQKEHKLNNSSFVEIDIDQGIKVTMEHVTFHIPAQDFSKYGIKYFSAFEVININSKEFSRDSLSNLTLSVDPSGTAVAELNEYNVNIDTNSRTIFILK